LWLQDLPPEDLQAVGLRLRLSAKMLDWIEQTQKLWQLLPTLPGKSPSQITNNLKGFHDIPVGAVSSAATNPTCAKSANLPG
jgi:hypothetical protein